MAIKVRDICWATGIVFGLVFVVSWVMLIAHTYNKAQANKVVFTPPPIYPDLTYCHAQEDLWDCIRNADYAKAKLPMKMWRNDL